LAELAVGVFASGRGSNFQAILKAIEAGRLEARIVVLISNKQDAGALEIARGAGIPTSVISKPLFESREAFIQTMLQTLETHGVDTIVLAGYMKKIPPEVVNAYRNRILNIHPALLPSFGGKGMYGMHVHEAVLQAGCKVSGVTVHLVDEVYDRGPIVAQRCVPVEPGDGPGDLAARVLSVEHQLYAEALQLFAQGRVQVIEGRVVISEA
jgi:phosphoribosylglycinamide formyltransferase-1